ncbi:hypothetical protein LCGC14_0232240 [marine sediment metagenome]|uniref:VWFA domain-containing protein n=1 Tax=marine sediment metagenome TaxID=412755 RepID=A0A0F9WUS4_9ZZZZ
MAKANTGRDLVTLKTTVVTFVLDETGSMEMIRDDTIGGFNTYLDSLRDESKGKVEFSLIKFDSMKIDKVHVGEHISKVPNLTRETYIPGAATPLVDACVKSIRATEAALKQRDDEPNVLFVIQTDGQENASTEYNFTDLTTLIKQKEAEGWSFLFMGAGIDAYDVAVRQMGMAAAATMSYDLGSSKAAFAAVASNTDGYRESGMRSDTLFSNDQKTEAGDRFMTHGKKSSGHVQQATTTSGTDHQKTSAVDDLDLTS